MEKMMVLYDKVIDIIDWADNQGFINEEQATLLIDNINDALNEIRK